MRILFLGRNLGTFRGTERMLLETAKTFAAEHDTVIWGYEGGGETEKFIVAAGIRCLAGPKHLDEMRAFKPDIVNIHRGGGNDKNDTRILKAFKAIGSKIIETDVFGIVDYQSDKFIDLSLQISRWDLYRWNKRRGPFTKILGIYLPYLVDTDTFTRASAENIKQFRAKLSIPENAFVLGRCGKTAWQGISAQLQTVLDKHENFHFISVDDYAGGEIPSELATHPRVHRIPRLYSNEQLSVFYSACSATLGTSPIGESFGMVIAEPLACGTPVITHNTPQVDDAQAEIVRHGENGWLVKNLDCLAELLDGILSGRFPLSMDEEALRQSIVKRYSRPVVSQMLRRAFAAVHESISQWDLGEKLAGYGFESTIPDSEFRHQISQGIGAYTLKARIWTAINLHYPLRKLYAFYNRILGR